MQTFLFYDLETTGLNKSFDQIIQFAAIRTDKNFKELNRHEFRIKLNPDNFPSPEALITHRQGINTFSEGLSEFDAIKKIHHLINTPGTISLGYNTLGFDDEFLRFSFYRNLLPPYTHQYANQCMRMDIYPVTLMYYLYKNEILNWPVLNDKISLKLENINKANKLFKGQAHDAMTDVEVTLELAKRLSTDKAMWNYVLGYFNKKTDIERVKPLQKNIALMLQGKLGSNSHFQCPVIFLGDHKHYRNQSLWLRLDSEELSTAAIDTIDKCSFALNKKFGEPGFLLPNSNRFCKHLTNDRISLAQSNLNNLKANPKLFKSIQKYHTEFKWPEHPTADWEAQLYMSGFFTREEDLFSNKFHEASPDNKAKLASRAPSERLKNLSARIIARNYSDKLTPTLEKIYRPYYKKCLIGNPDQPIIDFKGKLRVTPQQALNDISKLKLAEKLSDDTNKILDEYSNWLDSKIN